MGSLRVGIKAICVSIVTAQLMSCALIMGARDAVKVAGSCPDIGSLGAIAKIDFADEFGFDMTTGAKVKAGVIAATSLSKLAADIDGDLQMACGGLAKDLGSTAPHKDGAEACTVAAKAITEAKAKLGASAQIRVDAQPPVCSASLSAVADCAAQCDASVDPGAAHVQCEGGSISGVCDAECTGTCELSAAASCNGSCEGACDGSFSGQCGGTCEGRCDGQEVSGACAGTCEGSCDAAAKGSCGGNCDGSCAMAAAGSCAGTCSGECSVALKEPTCSGTLVPPKMSAECKSSCDAHTSANLACTSPSIAVVLEGVADAEAAARYKAAVEKHLPIILKVGLGMGPKLIALVGSVTATVQGGIAAGQGILKSRPTASVYVTKCLLDPFTGAIDAVGSIKANIDVSVSVQASVSGSTSSDLARR